MVVALMLSFSPSQKRFPLFLSSLHWRLLQSVGSWLLPLRWHSRVLTEQTRFTDLQNELQEQKVRDRPDSSNKKRFGARSSSFKFSLFDTNYFFCKIPPRLSHVEKRNPECWTVSALFLRKKEKGSRHLGSSKKT